MKRIWIALAILLAVLCATLYHSVYLSHFTQDLSSLLEAAETEAESGDWDKAAALTQTAQDKWAQRECYLHITLRHDVTDNIYTDFREVWEFLHCQESGEYSAANARLIAGLELLSEAERLTLQNVL
ncbi:DUF4363 family protein [Vermiculatibacterium agrestimuris]|uniref:DUF4363 family protein n=1 Tax=Vermiculatibacterium agrestimuris TaxID=2941519 RepID=UPI00203B0C18|nr:DUF4363 family protein [Vermiculatibacterium agrestimuris]